LHFQAKDEARKAAAADNAELQVSTFLFDVLEPCSPVYETCSFSSTVMPKTLARVEDTALSQERLIGLQQVSFFVLLCWMQLKCILLLLDVIF
jgi:hypothetical protein